MMEWRFLYDKEKRFAIDYTPEFTYQIGLPQLDAVIVPETTLGVLEDLLQKHGAGKKTSMQIHVEELRGNAYESLAPLFGRAYDLRDATLEDAERTAVATDLKTAMSRLGYLEPRQLVCPE